MKKGRIVIVGFMGSGKTTVAEELARQLECAMVDLDSFITQREGRTPAEIIIQQGEPAFREIEALALREVLENRDARVIALGGGTWTVESNRALIARHDCVGVWLDTPFEVCWERIVASGTDRPLAPDRENTRLLFEARQSSYALSRLRIAVTGTVGAKQIVERILTDSSFPRS